MGARMRPLLIDSVRGCARRLPTCIVGVLVWWLAGHSIMLWGAGGGSAHAPLSAWWAEACSGVCCGWHTWSFAVFPVACPDFSSKVDVGLQWLPAESSAGDTGALAAAMLLWVAGGVRAHAAFGMVTGACSGACCGWHAWSFAVLPVACSSSRVDVGLQHFRIASGGHASHAFPGTP